MEKQETCEMRIDEHLKGRLLDIKAAIEDESDDQEKREEFDNNILSIDKRVEYKVMLSWGGPSDYFLIYVDPEAKEITDIEYHFQDWGDGAVRYLDKSMPIYDEDSEFDIVANMFSYLTEE